MDVTTRGIAGVYADKRDKKKELQVYGIHYLEFTGNVLSAIKILRHPGKYKDHCFFRTTITGTASKGCSETARMLIISESNPVSVPESLCS